MKKAKLYSFKDGMVFFSVMVLLMSVVLSSFPKSSAANDILDEQEIVVDSPDEIIELIKDTENEVIYKALEDGKIYLYEEQIVGDVITTKKSLVEDGTVTLAEEFSTTSVLEDDTISVTQVDLLNNKIIHQETVSTTPTPPVYDLTVVKPVFQQGVTPTTEFTTMATGTWVKARAHGNNYQYYKYSNGGGKARQLGREKTINYYTSSFDKFTRNVDSVRSLENGALADFSGLGLLDKAAKSIKKPTVANLKKFFRQYLRTIPGLGTIYLVIKYFGLCDLLRNSYRAIPATEYRLGW